MSKKRLISLHSVAILTIVLSLLVIILTNFTSAIRLWHSLKFAGIDIFHYFKNFFFKTDFNYPRIYHLLTYEQTLPSVDVNIPATFESFSLQFTTFFKILINRWNFERFIFDGLTSFILVLQLVYLVFLMVFPIRLLFKNQFNINDLNFTDKSKALKLFEKFIEKIFNPIKDYILDFFALMFGLKYYLIPIVLIWGLQLNFFSVLIDAFGFLFYFSSSFSFISIYHFFYTTIYSLYPFFSKIPLILYIVFFGWLFKLWQKKIAINRLSHKDAYNKGFAKSNGVVIDAKGPPRSSKTTLLNALGQDFDEIFREDFLNILETYSSMFPLFPWIELENMIKDLRDNGFLPNRYSIEKFINAIFEEEEFPFNYNFDNENKIHIGLGNKIVTIEQALITYAEAFYYYSYKGALVSANFSNRFDSIFIEKNEEKPQFGMWVYPALTIDPFSSKELEHFSKNIDFDAFRILKRVVPESIPPLTDIGIYLEMEASKQWGNQHDNKPFKRDDIEANPLNDGFTMFLSSFSHASLIDYTPFIRYIMDYQRSGDLGIKFSGMTETTITIIPTEREIDIALPFFYLTPLFYQFLINLRKKLYTRGFRHYRSDQTLFFNIINRLGAWATRRMLILTNNYGFKVLSLTTNSGNEDSGIDQLKKRKYFILNKKHYSDRFRSDALKVIYEDNEKMGFHAFENFKKLDMSEEELEYQNSYSFLNRFKRSQSGQINNDPTSII